MTTDSRTIMVGIVVILLVGATIWYATKDKTLELQSWAYTGAVIGGAGTIAFFVLKK